MGDGVFLYVLIFKLEVVARTICKWSVLHLKKNAFHHGLEIQVN